MNWRLFHILWSINYELTWTMNWHWALTDTITLKPVFKITWEIGTSGQLRTATSVRSHIQYVEMDLRNKSTSECRIPFLSPLGVPNYQVSLYNDSAYSPYHPAPAPQYLRVIHPAVCTQCFKPIPARKSLRPARAHRGVMQMKPVICNPFHVTVAPCPSITQRPLDLLFLSPGCSFSTDAMINDATQVD